MLQPQQGRRGRPDAGQTVMGQIVEAIVTLVQHLLPAALDPIVPQNIHVLKVLVVIPRRQPINGIANVDGKGRVVEAVHTEVVVDVAVDPLGDLGLLISVEGEADDGLSAGGVRGAVICERQGTAHVTHQAGPTGLSHVEKAYGPLPAFVGLLLVLFQRRGMPTSGKLEPVAEVSLAQIVAVLQEVRSLLHVVEGFVWIDEGWVAACFLLFVLPAFASGLD